MKLNHVHVPVSDLDQAVEFYQAELGWPLEFRTEDSAYFDAAGVVLERSKSPANPDFIVGLAVDDVDATYQDLIDRGVAVGDVPKDRSWGVRNFYVRDPDGNQVEYEMRLNL